MSEQRPPQPVRKDGERKPAYNAGDAAMVDEKRRLSKRQLERLHEGTRYIMSDPKGRAWMRHLISERLFTRVGTKRAAAIFTGNSTTFYNTALKELGDLLSLELATLTPAAFRQMEDEAIDATATE